MVDTLQTLTDYCQENNRICPMPRRWNELYELLPNRRRAGGGYEPAAPLTLAAWHTSPAFLKMMRLSDCDDWRC